MNLGRLVPWLHFTYRALKSLIWVRGKYFVSKKKIITIIVSKQSIKNFFMLVELYAQVKSTTDYWFDCASRQTRRTVS